jgi:hypothetical protein
VRGSVFGYELESELPLERLREEAGSRGRLVLERAKESILDRSGELTGWAEPAGGRTAFALARTDAGLIAWCSATGSYQLDATAGCIRVEPARGVNPSWEHRLLSMALPMLLSERGDLAFHASAAVVGEGAVLFCGPSGRGKSTLAISAAALGHRVLAEDGAIITLQEGVPTVWPGPRAVRLKDDSASALARSLLAGRSGNGTGTVPRPAPGVGIHPLPPDAEAPTPVPVRAILTLEERGPDLAVKPLDPAEGLAAMVENLFHAGRAEGLRPAYRRAAQLAERVPVYRVTVPDDLAGAPASAERLLHGVVGPVGRKLDPVRGAG